MEELKKGLFSCPLCANVGLFEHEKDPNAEKIEKKFEEDAINIPVIEAYANHELQIKKKKEVNEGNVKNTFIMGQNATTTSANQAAEWLLIRDYKNIANYDGKHKLGAIFAPETFIQLKPDVIYPERKKVNYLQVY